MTPKMKEDSQKKTLSEFTALCWSVINSEECAASGLSYESAVELVRQMSAARVSAGLCIVTDKAAHRILRSNGSGQKIRNEQSEDSAKHFTETL